MLVCRCLRQMDYFGPLPFLLMKHQTSTLEVCQEEQRQFESL